MYRVMQQIRLTLGGRRVTARALLPWAILIVLVAGAAVVLGRSGAWSTNPEIVVRVNGESVTRGDVQRLLADPLARRELQRELGVQEPDSKAMGRLAVRTLINRRLILQEAGRRKVTITQEDLSQATKALRGRFKELKDLGAWMQARGLDDVSLQELLRNDLLMTRTMTALVDGVKLSDGQVEEYYAVHKANLNAAETTRLRIIAVKDTAAIGPVMMALKKGEDFERLARERSTVRAEQGGDLGWVNPAGLKPALREAVKNLKTRETSPPVEVGGQVLLVRMEERRPAHPMTLAEARPTIEQRLLAPKQQAVVQAWLTDQRKKAKIEVLRQPGSFATEAMTTLPNN